MLDAADLQDLLLPLHTRYCNAVMPSRKVRQCLALRKAESGSGMGGGPNRQLPTVFDRCRIRIGVLPCGTGGAPRSSEVRGGAWGLMSSTSGTSSGGRCVMTSLGSSYSFSTIGVVASDSWLIVRPMPGTGTIGMR